MSEPSEGVQVPIELVVQAQQQRIEALNQECVMLNARRLDLERQLGEAQGKLAALDGSP